MTREEFAYLIVLIVIIVVALFYIQKLLAQIEMMKQKASFKKDNSQFSLSAYERLTMFTERTKLENLITRFNDSNQPARVVQAQMVAAIKEEFEHNVTQQVYVNPGVWDALVKMKEQNIYILYQVLQTVNPDESATPYLKNLLTFIGATENATMNTMVLNALAHEAKQIL